MRQIFTLLALVGLAFTLGACHCKKCHVSLPGGCCEPCPQKPKPLRPPKPKNRCEFPVWPDRPVKCVTTQICRKCCHCETHCTKDGYQYQVEVCEITYKALYSDGSTKIWTEVSRNPVTQKRSSKLNRSSVGKRMGDSYQPRHPIRHSIVCDRCEGEGPAPLEPYQCVEKKKH